MSLTDVSALQPSTATKVLFEANEYVELTILKETSGNVVIGTAANLDPIGSGKGMALPADVPVVVTMNPGTRLYFIGEDEDQRISLVKRTMDEAAAIMAIMNALKMLAPQAFQGTGEFVGFVPLPPPTDGGPLAVGDSGGGSGVSLGGVDLGDYMRSGSVSRRGR